MTASCHPEKRHYAHGKCEACYKRAKRHERGLVGRKGPKPRPIEERLMDKFLIGDGCWEWTGSKEQGYGRIGLGGKYGRPIQAHRAVYEWLVGPIPEGLELDHLCRNPGCVRPDHMEAVTGEENRRRQWATQA